MKAPDNRQLTPSNYFSRELALAQAASDMARHAFRECDKTCGGDPARLADLLFEQSKVMARASALLVDAGVVALAGGARKKWTRP